MEKPKSKKRIVIIAVLAVVLLVAVIGLVTMWPMLSMKPATTGVIADTEIAAVNNGMNSLYFLPSTDGYIAVDAGTDAQKAIQEMAALGIEPQDVKHVLLTHTDYDHVAALAHFPGAQIYMSEDELQMIDGTTKRNAAQSNALPDGVARDSLVLLRDGQELEIGGHSIACVKAPGHTPGSMAYKLDGAYLFTGDAARVSGGGMEIHPFTMDEAAAAASLQVLREEMDGCRLVLTAHYGYYPCGALR